MATSSDAIERLNELLCTHTAVESFTWMRSGYAYDGKVRLRGAGLLVLKLRQFSALNALDLDIGQMRLQVADVRTEQHDRVNYEITLPESDCSLLRCQSMVLIAGSERLELQ